MRESEQATDSLAARESHLDRVSKIHPGDDKMPHHPRGDLNDGDKPIEPKASALPSLPPHATPLPRLGCGGPSHENQTVAARMSPYGRALDTKMPESEQATDILAARESHLDLVSKSGLHRQCHHETDAILINPPTPCQAMPLPRLGCGGPPQMSNGEHGKVLINGIHSEPPMKPPAPAFQMPSEKQQTSVPESSKLTAVDQSPKVCPTLMSGVPTWPCPEAPHSMHPKPSTHNAEMPMPNFLNTMGNFPGYLATKTGRGEVSTHASHASDNVQKPDSGSEAKDQPLADQQDESNDHHPDAGHPPNPPHAMPLPRLGCGGPTHEGIPPCESLAGEVEPVAEDMKQSDPHETMQIFVLHEDAKYPIPCRVPIDATLGTLTVAEARLQTMSLPIAPRSIVGTHLPLDQMLHSEQYVVLHESLPKSSRCPFLDTKYSTPPAKMHLGLPCTRIEALWRQKAWVAADEMAYYLEATQYGDQANPFPPANFQDEADALETAMDWLAIGMEAHDTDKPWCSAAIIASHWVPVIIEHHDQTIKLITTPEGSCLLEPASLLTHAAGKTLEVTQRILPTTFAGDCGFQSIAWMIAILNDHQVEAMSATRASQWRHLFVRELCKRGTSFETIHHLNIGGSKLDAREMQQLSEILMQHGVWPERAMDRANALASAVPAPSIRNIFNSNRPWQDLKAAANLVKPQFKLIMPDELNAQIAHRTNQRKYGKKSQAKRNDANKDHITVKAAELVVPHGVFKQQDNTILGPMQVGDVGPNAKGVLLVDQEDCHATLRLPTPVTQAGLAVIVLATKQNTDQHQMEPIRFPAMCVSTQEPLIASGYLYQLGSQPVVRHEPTVKLAIEEQDTEAMRCLIFKDQAGKLWDQIQQHPVKHIFATEPLLAVVDNVSPVIDVWDRQWVSKKFEKVRPASAEIFAFSFRMLADKSELLLTKSGQNGIYWEPRAPCGRFPNDGYHVTWLSNMTFQDAKYAQQTSPQATTLARHGDRYGLRSDVMNAQEIHDKHQPNTPLLMGQSKMLYAVGQAKPLQPKGRAQDGSGVTWHIQATEDPGHWVYSLQHGDVLVTKIQDTKPPAVPMPYSIVASKKTIEHFQGPDPWAHYDPWRKDGQQQSIHAAKPTNAAQPSQPVTQAQLAAWEANMEKKIQAIAKNADGDANMEPSQVESRITELESKVNQVQHMQAGMDSKVNMLQAQIDHQSKLLGDRIDEKMSEQMDRIEQLLCKRSRFE